MNVSQWLAKFDEVASSAPKSKPLMVEEETALTYGDLFQRVRQCGALFASLGLNVEDRVIVATQDNPSLIILFFALLRNGITAVILDPGASKIEARALVQAADAKVVFADAAFLETGEFDKLLPESVSYTTIASEKATGTGLLGRMLGRKTETSVATNFPAMLNALDAVYEPPASLDEDTVGENCL